MCHEIIIDYVNWKTYQISEGNIHKCWGCIIASFLFFLKSLMITELCYIHFENLKCNLYSALSYSRQSLKNIICTIVYIFGYLNPVFLACDVQGSKSVQRSTVGVCLAVQQQLCNLDVTAMRGHVQSGQIVHRHLNMIKVKNQLCNS